MNEIIPYEQFCPRSLDEIAESIRSHWRATEDDRFAIGRDLLEARAQFPGDREFGRWFVAQRFPFAQTWARLLQASARREAEVRDVLSTQLLSTGRTDFAKAVRQVIASSRDPVADKATADIIEALHSEDDTPLFVAFRDACEAFIAGVAQMPTDELYKIAPLVQRVIEAYGAAKSDRQDRGAW